MRKSLNKRLNKDDPDIWYTECDIVVDPGFPERFSGKTFTKTKELRLVAGGGGGGGAGGDPLMR